MADSVPASAQELVDTYKDVISGYINNAIIFKDGTKMTWDDGVKNKSFQALLQQPDLKDMFGQVYVKGKLQSSPVKDYDPGRIRNDSFFKRYMAARRRR